MEKEIFKDIPGYESLYQVSNLGNVKSLKYYKERILKPSDNGYGYYTIKLYKEGKQKTIRIHILVAMAFLNHVPDGYKIVVDHINNDKLDNRVENLQLITQRENNSKDKKGYSSKYTGVTWHKVANKWVSTIRVGVKKKYLGLFIDEYEAHLAYQKALKELK